MSVKADASQTRLDVLKWSVVAAFVVLAVAGNLYYAAQPLLYRVLGLVALSIGAGLLALRTARGRAFLGLAKEARAEIRKVVWPTRQETAQTTSIVVLVVLIMALVLWGLDALLGLLVSLIAG